MSLFRRLLSARHSEDFLPGDPVRRIGFRGIGWIESITQDHAVVAWDKDRRDILPLTALRRARTGWRDARFDTRHGQ